MWPALDEGRELAGHLTGQEPVLELTTVPLSIRFDAPLLARLRRRASATSGSTASALAQRLIDADHGAHRV